MSCSYLVSIPNVPIHEFEQDLTLIDGHFTSLFSVSLSLSQGPGGRQFISVLDLEDKALHQDLPRCLSPEVQDVPPLRPPSPTSAQLHVLATSVIRSASAAADPQPVPEDFHWRPHTGLYIV